MPIPEPENSHKEVSEKLRVHFSPLEGFANFFIPYGWLSLVEQLNARLENRDPNYILGQVKEKFGGLRYYLDVDHSVPDDVSDEEYEEIMNSRWAVYNELQEIVREYESRSLYTCQDCGDINAFLRDCGWLVTLCDSCFALVERDY